MFQWRHAALPIAVLVSSTVHADSSTPAPPGQWSIIPLASFQPARANTEYTWAGDGSSAYITRKGDDGAFHAPFGLPAGSRVHEVCVFAYDDTPGNELSLSVVFTELGDANRNALSGARVDTIVTTGLEARPRYTRLCKQPSRPLVLQQYGDASGDGVPGWLDWSISVEPVVWGHWPQVGWGAAQVRWSLPETAAPPGPPDGESSR
jgi:hypothetical protein